MTFVLNLLVEAVGPETLGAFVLNRPVIGELLGGIIGFIPNCAASVVLTTLYLEGAMSGGAMLSGLLVGSGVGLLVLLRMNRDWRDNLVTAGLLYAGGVIFGLLADVLAHCLIFIYGKAPEGQKSFRRLSYDFTAVLIESRNTTKRLKRNSVTALTSIVGTRIANSFQPCCASASPHQIESGVNTR